MWVEMKVLLDTNIIIHRERIHPVEKEIGKLFWGLDKLEYQKYIHQRTIDEIHKMQDEKLLEALGMGGCCIIGSFIIELKRLSPPVTPQILYISDFQYSMR